MSAHEVLVGFRWIKATATADSLLQGYAPGGIYRSEAPQGTVTPFVIMSYQAGSDVTTANGVRLISTPLYQIRVSGPASATDKLEQAVSRLDDLFARTDGFTQGGLVLACYREQPLAFDQIVNGKQWSSFGGLYRLEIQQIS